MPTRTRPSACLTRCRPLSQMHDHILISVQVFTRDVQNLLRMTDMWRTRAPPVPLDFADIISTPISDAASGLPSNSNCGSATSATNGVSRGLKDQKALTLRETLDMFVSRYVCCCGYSSHYSRAAARIASPCGYRAPSLRAVKRRSLSTRMMTTRWILCVQRRTCGAWSMGSQAKRAGKLRVRVTD